MVRPIPWHLAGQTGKLYTLTKKGNIMTRYMLLHYGFEKPTPEIMEAWKAWFTANAERTVENGGFHGAAKEISKEGSSDLVMDSDCITGYTIIEAENIEEAEKIASENPFITGIRIYEIVNH